MKLTPEQLETLVHAFETLEGIEQRIDDSRGSRGSYACALAHLGLRMDAAVSLYSSDGKKPENTLELLVFCFHPESWGAR